MNTSQSSYVSIGSPGNFFFSFHVLRSRGTAYSGGQLESGDISIVNILVNYDFKLEFQQTKNSWSEEKIIAAYKAGLKILIPAINT